MSIFISYKHVDRDLAMRIICLTNYRENVNYFMDTSVSIAATQDWFSSSCLIFHFLVMRVNNKNT